MEIDKYTSFFHDGIVHNIVHKNDKLELSMESAELIPEWNEDNIDLSKRSTISGILYLERIKSIEINGELYTAAPAENATKSLSDNDNPKNSLRKKNLQTVDNQEGISPASCYVALKKTP